MSEGHKATDIDGTPLTQLFHEALLSIWSEIDGLEKTADNPFFHSKYIPLETLMGAAKPICIKHKVLIQQGCGEKVDHDFLWVYTRLIHVPTGESQLFEMPVPWPFEEIKNKQTGEIVITEKRNAQVAGSMFKYGRRYTLMGALALVAEEDDDGNVASSPQSGLVAAYKPRQSSESGGPGDQDAPPPEEEYASSQKSFPSGNTWTGKLTEVKMVKGVNKQGKAWERCDVTFAGDTIGTFNESIRDRAMQAWGNKIAVTLQWSMSGKYKSLDRLDLEFDE